MFMKKKKRKKKPKVGEGDEDFFNRNWRDEGTQQPFSQSFRTYLKNMHTMFHGDVFEKQSPEECLKISNSVFHELLNTLNPNEFVLLLNGKMGSEIFEKLLPFVDRTTFLETMMKVESRYCDLFRGNFSSYIMERLLGGIENIFGDLKKNAAPPELTSILDLIYEDVEPKLVVLVGRRSCVPLIVLLVELFYVCKQFDKGRNMLNIVYDVLRTNPEMKDNEIFQTLLGKLMRSYKRFRLTQYYFVVENILCLKNSKEEEDGEKKMLSDTRDSRVKRKINFSVAHGKFLELCFNETGSHLIESVIRTLDDENFHNLYLTIFKRKIQQYSFKAIMNFVVATVIERASRTSSSKREIFETIFESLSPSLHDLFLNQCKNVFENIVKGCVALKIKYEELCTCFIEQFQDSRMFFVTPGGRICAFGCKVLTFVYQKFPWRSTKFIEFNNVVHKLLHEDKKLFYNLCVNKNGIGFVTGLMEGCRKNRMLIKDLNGKFAELARDVYGAQIINKFFLFANDKQLFLIGREILRDEEAVKKTKCGNWIFSKYKLYKLKNGTKKLWLEALRGQPKGKRRNKGERKKRKREEVQEPNKRQKREEEKEKVSLPPNVGQTLQQPERGPKWLRDSKV